NCRTSVGSGRYRRARSRSSESISLQQADKPRRVAVPELTSGADINLNRQVSLPMHSNPIACPRLTLPHVPPYPQAKPPHRRHGVFKGIYRACDLGDRRAQRLSEWHPAIDRGESSAFSGG